MKTQVTYKIEAKDYGSQILYPEDVKKALEDIINEGRRIVQIVEFHDGYNVLYSMVVVAE